MRRWPRTEVLVPRYVLIWGSVSSPVAAIMIFVLLLSR